MSDVDPADLDVALRVLKQAGELQEDDPTYVALRRATGGFFKDAKRERRRRKREAEATADRTVVELTATGSASRI
ncbi:MAG TPA: short-chain dehydrogenase, partial [Aeromicrobium sp.]|nr:short-chain dehydrogenase [Aeromicrobium sp.]